MTDLHPWSFQQWAFKLTVGNSGRKHVLSTLATLAETTSGRCEAKHETIAQAVELTQKSVSAHLLELRRQGIIAQRPQFRHDGRQRGNEYLLLAPWVTEWPDGQPIERLDGRSSDEESGTYKDVSVPPQKSGTVPPQKSGVLPPQKSGGQELPLKELPPPESKDSGPRARVRGARASLDEIDQPTLDPQTEKRVDLFLNVHADKVVARGATRPNKTKTAREAARWVLRKEPDANAICARLDWALAHRFWSDKVLTLPLFKRNWDRLTVQWKADVEAETTSRRNGHQAEWVPRIREVTY